MKIDILTLFPSMFDGFLNSSIIKRAIDKKIVELLRPKDMQTPVELVFQSIEGLHNACPNHPGDWYFTGHYPTPGGIRLVNNAFVEYVEKTLKMQL